MGAARCAPTAQHMQDSAEPPDQRPRRRSQRKRKRCFGGQRTCRHPHRTTPAQVFFLDLPDLKMNLSGWNSHSWFKKSLGLPWFVLSAAPTHDVGGRIAISQGRGRRAGVPSCRSQAHGGDLGVPCFLSADCPLATTFSSPVRLQNIRTRGCIAFTLLPHLLGVPPELRCHFVPCILSHSSAA